MARLKKKLVHEGDYVAEVEVQLIEAGEGWSPRAISLSGCTREGYGGGAERDRTVDLLNAIQALSQLSYGPTERESLARAAGGVKRGVAIGARGGRGAR
jgi:hypothetical protein